jgi:hypothetical protein
MSLWVDKHRPTSLKHLDYNQVSQLHPDHGLLVLIKKFPKVD